MSPDRLRDHLAITMAAFLYGLITVGGKYFADLGFSLFEISLLPLFAAALIFPFVLFVPKYRVAKSQLVFCVGFGFIGALLQLGQFTGIVLGVPVALVALLLYTQPVWTTFLGRWLLKEEITKVKLVAATLAVLGMLTLVNPFAAHGSLNIVGIVAALLAGIFLSLWVIFGRKGGLSDGHFVATTFGYTLFTGCWLLALQPILEWALQSDTFTRLDWRVYLGAWGAVLMFAVFVTLAPNFLAFWGLKRVDASTAGILLLLEPVSAALFAYLFFGQALSTNLWFGGLLILLGNVILVTGASKNSAA